MVLETETNRSEVAGGSAPAHVSDPTPSDGLAKAGASDPATDSDLRTENGAAEGGSPATANGSAAVAQKLPKYLYTAMEQVARQQGFTDGQYTIDFDVGSNKGDGFVGEMFKAFLVEGDRREVFLCKIPPLNEARRQQFPFMSIFARETLAYSTLLPKIVAYQEQKGIDRADGFFNVPRCYYTHCDEATQEVVIVMEDLRLDGYRMWNKLIPVNYEHARLMMERLGKLHAVSLAMKADRLAEFEQFKVPDLMEQMMPPGSPFEQMMKKMIRDAMETLEPHETEARSKMQTLHDGYHQEMTRCTNGALAEPYTVLGHGDCWVNNFMFRYKNGTPEKIIFLDWQITRYVSPVLDLLYFIFCCTDDEFRRQHYEEVLTLYYNSLAIHLERMGHRPQTVFPRTALMRQLQQFGRFGIYMAVFLIPMMSTRNEDIIDLDAAAEQYRDTQQIDEEAFKFKFDQETYRKRMSGVIRDCLRYGYM